MSTIFTIGRWACVLAVALLSTAATNQVADALYNRLTITNVQRVVTNDEVEQFTRDHVAVTHAIIDLQAVAWASNIDLTGVDDWLGLEFATGFDDQGTALSSAIDLSILDMANVSAANAKFDEIRSESMLVESNQGIGDRFAGLSPQVAGLDTIVLFRVGDKIVMMTTTTTDNDPKPLVDSNGLVSLARLIAPRFSR